VTLPVYVFDTNRKKNWSTSSVSVSGWTAFFHCPMKRWRRICPYDDSFLNPSESGGHRV
jgi:hypothetical protein